MPNKRIEMDRTRKDIVKRVKAGESVPSIALSYGVKPVTIYARLRKWKLSVAALRSPPTKAVFAAIPGYPGYRLSATGIVQAQDGDDWRTLVVRADGRKPLACRLRKPGAKQAESVSLRTLLVATFPGEGERLFEKLRAAAKR